MSHEMDGNRGVFRGEPAWHELGYVVPRDVPITIGEAIKMGDIDFEIQQFPLFVSVNGLMIPYGRNAIVRVGSPESGEPCTVYGEAGDGYSVLQNDQIGALVEPLAAKWPLETVGSLERGKTLFLTLDAGEVSVRGDPVRQFFLISDTRDGKTSLGISFTPIRVVCYNTLTAGKAAAIATTNLKHTQNLATELQWRVELLGKMQNVQKAIMSGFDAMAQAVLNAEAVAQVFDAVYQLPKEPSKVTLNKELLAENEVVGGEMAKLLKTSQDQYESGVKLAEERREAVRNVFGKFNDENPKYANTGWATYNAVVEYEDYREDGKREDGMVSAIFGNRAKVKSRAFAEVMAQLPR